MKLPPSQDVVNFWHEPAVDRRTTVPSGGKWMMFFSYDDVDAAWQRALTVYDSMADALAHMQVGTSKPHPKATYDTHVISFYCGPHDDEGRCVSVGEELVRRMEYGGAGAARSPYIHYQPMISGSDPTWRVMHACTDPPPGVVYMNVPGV